MILVWILVGSLMCSLIYSTVTYDYMRYEAMWEECLFPGMVVWKKLKETNLSVVSRAIITGIVWLALFIYPLILTLLCVLIFLPIAVWEFIKYMVKGE